MPPKDPPALHHHLRIECSDLSEAAAAIVGFPAARAVVRHQAGKTGEHPHLHIYLENERPLTKVAVKDRLRKHNEFFKTLSGNENWSFRPHDNYEAWCRYVKRNPTHEVIKADQAFDEVKETLPIVALQPQRGAVSQIQILKAPRRTMRDKFIHYLEAELHWKRGAQYGLTDESPEAFWKRFETDVVNAATDYFEAAFTVPEGIRMTKHAMFVFATSDIQELLKDRMVQQIRKSLWS